MKRLAAFLLAATMLAGAFAAPAMAEKRLALIIGNSAYRHSGELDNPSHDAQLIASVLRRAGFETTVRIDAERKAMKEAFRAYANDIRAAGKDAVGFFYYAGHGTQVNGVNYLLPVDANIENESQVESEAISASGLMAQLEGAGNRMNIVILDSCRNNPFKRGYRAQVRGLAPMHAPASTLIGYSTQPGNVALDGSAGYSPYAIALHRAIREPGQTLEQTFKRARLEVNQATDGKQIPWEESSLFGDFYFFPEGAKADITPAAGDIIAVSEEARLWKDIRQSRDPESFRGYLDKHPSGTFALLATDRLERLRELAAAKPDPEVRSPQAGVYFFDDFDGVELSKDWDVMNPDPDAYIVEDGMLTVLLSEVAKPSMETVPNIFRLLKPIPKGDWTMTVRLVFVPQTMSEWLSAGVMKRDGNGLTSTLQVHTSNYGRETRVFVRGDKKSRRNSEFSQELIKLYVPDARNIIARSDGFKQYFKAALLRLRKVGRRYVASIKFEPGTPDDPKKTVAADWVDLPKLTSLRVPGDRFTLLFRTTRTDNYLPANTESLVNIDWVRIETGAGAE
jgi:hypothetical protein